MGSFNATCIISNFQIEAGTPVRFFLLTKSRFSEGENGLVCYVGGRWQLRGAAIRAQYDDYGSVEKIEDSFTTRMLFEALKRDVVEKGVGDNQCHDVQVRPDMPQEDWLDALREGRVFVRDAVPSTLTKDYVPPEPPKGMPSITRLEKILKGEGLSVVNAYGAEGYVIDEVSQGFIRIRFGRSFGNEGHAPLERILPAVHKAGYAAMLTCGTGHYANPAEVLVAPLPAPKDQHFFTSGLSEEISGLDQTVARPVTQVMVREDVWQILLDTPLSTFRGDWDLARMKSDALKWLERAQEKLRISDPVRRSLMRWDDLDIENIFSCGIHGNEGTSGFSLRSAFYLGVQLAQDPEELRQYVLDLAEMAYVEWQYASLHGQWHPTTNSSQEGRWEEHRAFLRKLLEIKGHWEDESEDVEDEDESDEDDEEVGTSPTS